MMPTLLTLGAVLTASLLVLLIYVLCWVPKRFIAHFQRQGVPGFPYRFIKGQWPEIRASVTSDDIWQHHRACKERFGDIFTICNGPLPRLALYSAAWAEWVLQRNSSSYHKSTAGKMILGPLLGEGLLTSDGKLWRRHRSLISPAFHHHNIKHMVGFMVDCTRLALDKWERALRSEATLSIPGMSYSCGGQASLDVHRSMSALTLDVIASACFGSAFRDSPEVTEAVYQAFTDTLDELQKRNLSIIGLIPYVNRFPTPGWRKICRSIRKIHDVVLSIIEDRRVGKSHSLCQGPDLLDLLMQATTKDGKELSEGEIKDEAVTFAVAGHETTGNLMAWLFSYIAARDDVWDKCVAEVDSVLSDQPPTYETLKELKYLDAVINETLRLQPPVPTLRRTATEDNWIGTGNARILVPRGTMISICKHIIHRDLRNWDRPDEFLPERWLNKKKRDRCAFIPFGIGQRGCIGQNFARLEAKTIMAVVLQRFRVRLAPHQNIVPAMNLIMRPKYGVEATVMLRGRLSSE